MRERKWENHGGWRKGLGDQQSMIVKFLIPLQMCGSHIRFIVVP